MTLVVDGCGPMNGLAVLEPGEQAGAELEPKSKLFLELLHADTSSRVALRSLELTLEENCRREGGGMWSSGILPNQAGGGFHKTTKKLNPGASIQHFQSQMKPWDTGCLYRAPRRNS